MKLRRPTTRQTIYILFGIVLVMAAASTVASLHTFRREPATTSKVTGPPKTTNQSSNKTGQNSQNDSAETDGSTKADAAGTNDGGTPDDTNTANLACELLTPSIAQQIIGAEAKSSTPANVASIKTDDTSLEACAYSSTTGSVQLTIRTANGSLGVSKNATVFGSEKPSDAVNLPDYGESAYWDPGSRRLNILSSNTWYSIVTSSGTQTDAEIVAAEVAPQL